MAMTRYEKSKVAEFYGQAVADIINEYLSAAEEKERSRPGVGAPKAAKVNVNPCAYSVSRGAGNVKEYERKAEA